MQRGCRGRAACRLRVYCPHRAAAAVPPLPPRPARRSQRCCPKTQNPRPSCPCVAVGILHGCPDPWPCAGPVTLQPAPTPVPPSTASATGTCLTFGSGPCSPCSIEPSASGPAAPGMPCVVAPGVAPRCSSLRAAGASTREATPCHGHVTLSLRGGVLLPIGCSTLLALQFTA